MVYLLRSHFLTSVSFLLRTQNQKSVKIDQKIVSNLQYKLEATLVRTSKGAQGPLGWWLDKTSIYRDVISL